MGILESRFRDYDPQDHKDDSELDLYPGNYWHFGNYHQDTTPLKDVAEWSIDRQMQLSDAITRKYALNPRFHKHQLNQLKMQNRTPGIADLNQNSVGNVAFMAYHNPEHPEFQRMYHETLRIIRES
jgi:hypothetical protein